MLSLTTEQLNRLKFFNTSTPLVTSIDPTHVVENGEERQKVGQRFGVTVTNTYEIAGSLQDGDELADCPFIHKPWLRNWLPDDFSPAYPDMVKFLFEDVCQLPIATSRCHEIWAGAQMKAAERLEKIVKNSDLIAPDFVFVEAYKQLNVSWRKLERLCINNQLVLPNFVLWIGEILTVRKNFYNTPRSRFRHFIKTIEDSDCDQAIRESYHATAS